MPDRNEGQPKKRDDVVDGEIIAELPDETLMSLPPVEADQSEHLGIPKIAADEPPDAGRRQLLTRLAIGGAAALALGGSAALLISSNSGGQRVVVLPNGAQVNGDGTLDVAQLVKQIDDLQTELAACKTERDGLATQVASTSTDLTDARAALQAADALNTLWEQLDAIGLDDLLLPALQAAVTAFSAVQTVSTTLGNGITDVQNAVDQFIKQLPGPKAGLQWLQGQVTALANNLSNLGTQVQQAVEPVQPYAQMITNFVSWVLDRLPFGIGDKAKAGMNAMNSIVGGLPATVDGINQQVMNPLIVWFGDDQVRNVYGLLLTPVTDKLLEPARDIQTQLATFTDSFQNKLVTPAQSALDQRVAIRKQIDEMRAVLTKTS
jgi:hypothetical protein